MLCLKIIHTYTFIMYYIIRLAIGHKISRNICINKCISAILVCIVFLFFMPRLTSLCKYLTCLCQYITSASKSNTEVGFQGTPYSIIC